jgi:5-methylcytosine-specific restriction endonuclease McrA
MRQLSKQERAQLHGMFGGRCAYCGDELGKRWNADHVEPVERIYRWESGTGSRRGRYVYTGRMWYPERDHIRNLMPACTQCNNDKGSLRLEDWRARLQDLTGVLQRNYSAYRHAQRFGLVREVPTPVVFFFERPRRRIFNPDHFL